MDGAEEFFEMIRHTYDEDDAPRKLAEEMLEASLESADATTGLFLYAITNCEDEVVRRQACILFRRYGLSVAEDKRLWPNISADTKEAVKEGILTHLTAESNPQVRGSLRNVVIQLVMEEQALWALEKRRGGHFWPQILDTLWHMAKDSGDQEHRESALLILADVPLVFDELLEKYLSEINDLLTECMEDDSSLSTQIAAIKAFIGFIVEMDTKEHRQYLQPLLPTCFQVVVKACTESQVSAIDCLTALIELAEDRPKFFKPHMNVVIDTCHEITAAEALEDDTRRMAAEIVMELCEADNGMMRKYPEAVDKFIPLFLQYCTELEDDPEWSKQDADDIPDEEENHTVGEQMLDRMSISLGGIVLPKAFEYIPTMLESPRWQERAAGLTAIAAIAEGSLKEMKPELPRIVENVVPRLLDDHPRVRYMACNAVGQMSIDFAPKLGKERDPDCFQMAYHEDVIPHLLELMQDSENPRVQAHGAAALVNFCERAHEEVLKPYLEAILTRLMELLESDFRIVLEQTITCLATVADSSKHLFKDYYQHFMPHLKQILATPPPNNDWRLLRGKTMECITLIGIAVSKEIFQNDALEIMHAMAETEGDGDMDPDDPQITYMHAAWARICEVLGVDFVPFLEHVVRPLIRSLQLEPEIRILQPDDNAADLSGGAQAWEVGATGDNLRIGIKTAVLEEKRTACEMLRIYVQQLRGHFGPYIEGISEIIFTLLDFALDEEIRSLSVSLIPMLLTAAMESETHGLEFAATMWNTFGPKILDVAASETEIETQSYQMEAFNHCVEVLGIECLTEELMVKLTEIIKKQLMFYDIRCDERHKTRVTDEDHDEESEEKMTEEEEFENDNIRQLGDLIHTLFGNAGEAFLPYFNELLEHINKMLLPYPARTHFDHQLAISIFDDLVEYCGPKSYEYIEHFGEAMCFYLNSEYPELRQACAYGLGVCALHGGEDYTDMVAANLGTLNTMIDAEGSRSSENINATENAISAIIKTVLTLPGAGPSFEEALPNILDWLPILADEEEAKYVYTQLCEKIMQNDATVCEPENIAKIIHIFANVLGEKKIAPFKPPGSDQPDEYFVGEYIKKTVLQYWQANEEMVNEIISTIPDTDESNQMRSNFLQHLGVEGK